jgi:hypothetical protein
VIGSYNMILQHVNLHNCLSSSITFFFPFHIFTVVVVILGSCIVMLVSALKMKWKGKLTWLMLVEDIYKSISKCQYWPPNDEAQLDFSQCCSLFVVPSTCWDVHLLCCTLTTPQYFCRVIYNLSLEKFLWINYKLSTKTSWENFLMYLKSTLYLSMSLLRKERRILHVLYKSGRGLTYIYRK